MPYQNNSANDELISYAYKVPFISEGGYIGIVQTQTNLRDPNLQNNFGYATASLQVTSQTQVLNTPVVLPLATGTQVLYKIVNVPVKNTLVASLVIYGSSAYHRVYLNYRTPPTGYVYDGYSQVLLSSQQKALVTNTKAGNYFISVQSFGSYTENYSISFLVQIANFEIFGISPSTAIRYGTTTIRFSGTQFSRYIAASIVSDSFIALQATQVYWYSSVEVYATFELSVIPIGLYSMRLTDKITGNTAQLSNCFSVVAGIPGCITMQASVIQTARSTQPTGAVAIHISNTGGTDMITPMVFVRAPKNTVVQLMGRSTVLTSSTLGVLLQPSRGPGGFISPGVNVDLQFTILPTITGTESIDIIQVQGSVEPHPYIAQKQILQPVAIPAVVWDIIWSNFLISVGSTWSTLYTRASQIATELSLVLRQEYILDAIINYQLHISYGLLTG